MDISEESHEFLSPLDPLDDLWTLYEGIFEQNPISGNRPNMTNDNEIDVSADIIVEQRQMETPGLVVPLDKGLEKMKKNSNTPSNSKKRREIIRRNSSIIIESKGKGKMLDGDGEGLSSSVAKKMDHNARERIRRMKVNASYLALRALLPDSRRSKKRWSAPSIVDKVLKYIPELEKEIEELAYKKEQVQSVAANKNNPNNISNDNIENPSRFLPTVSVHGVSEDEAIVQICMDAKEEGSAFAKLLQRVEDEGICINSASTLYVYENRTSSHLHIQMNRASNGAEYVAELEDKFISWLR